MPDVDEQAYLVLEARAGGMSYAAIQRAFGVSRRAAKQIEGDPDLAQSFTAWALDREAEQAAELVLQTMSITDAAQQLGVSRVTVYKRLARVGIQGLRELIDLERALVEMGATRLSAQAIRAAAEEGLPALVTHLTGDNPEWSVKSAGEIRHLIEAGLKVRGGTPGPNVTVSNTTTVQSATVVPSSAPTADEMDPEVAAEIVRIMHANKQPRRLEPT